MNQINIKSIYLFINENGFKNVLSETRPGKFQGNYLVIKFF